MHEKKKHRRNPWKISQIASLVFYKSTTQLLVCICPHLNHLEVSSQYHCSWSACFSLFTRYLFSVTEALPFPKLVLITVQQLWIRPSKWHKTKTTKVRVEPSRARLILDILKSQSSRTTSKQIWSVEELETKPELLWTAILPLTWMLPIY